MNTETQKEYDCFLQQYPEYKNTAILDQKRATEYKRLDDNNQVYLDYTGGNLYGKSQLEKHHKLLQENIFGNPHSINPSSLFATQQEQASRKYILEFFNAQNDYMCVFTPNASGALKIVGESYPFNANSHLLLSFDNHNSVHGVREFAKRKGATYSYSPLYLEDLTFDEKELEKNLNNFTDKQEKLFMFPAQSNVSGAKHPLEWVAKAQAKGWDVMLDAAAFVPTNKLDLKAVQPEFVCVSFYKIFGYPTGMGALLIKKSAFNKLVKPWFGGGTITLASIMADNYFLTDSYSRFEDGTINYLDIPALKIGLEYINEIGIDTINTRVHCFTSYALEQLSELKHENGKEVVHVFGPSKDQSRGGTIILNFYDKNGKAYYTEDIESQAAAVNISLRVGCFCNPGIDEIYNGLTSEELSGYFNSREKGSFQGMIEYMGKLRGAIRISFGLATNFNDILAFMKFAKSFVNK